MPGAGIQDRFVAAAAVSLILICSACSGQSAPPPTPNPFQSVAQQADDAYAQGVQLFQQGRYSEALDQFKRARLLSPTDDPRIDDMLQQTSAILTPTATPPPPTPEPTPAPTAVAQSSATPATDVADAYFGQVFLSIVPGASGTAVPMAAFSIQDQLGIYIEKLDERLHLGFTLRLFDADSGALVTNTSGDSMQRFPGKFVWYHQGGERVGHFRIELYAADVLTNTFEYVVGTEPVPIPTQPAPTPAPAQTMQPTQTSALAPPSQPNIVPAPTPIATPIPMPAPAVPAPTRPPAPPPVPTPLPAPEPQAVNLTIAAGPSALAVQDGSDQLYVADRSGLVWILEHGQPSLREPFRVSGEPVGLAADAANGRLYVAARGDRPAIVTFDTASASALATLALPSNPGDLALEAELGLLYVVLPDQDALATIDVRAGSVVRITPGLQHVSGIVLDRSRRTLFLSQLQGDLAAVDLQTGAISATAHLTDVGLAGLAIGGDRVYAINTPGQKLISVDWTNRTAESVPLDLQPAALVFGQDSGTLYVLDADGSAVERVSSADGANLGAIPVTGAGQATSLDPATLWQRPRMAINALDETVYVIQPDAALLAIAAP